MPKFAVSRQKLKDINDQTVLCYLPGKDIASLFSREGLFHICFSTFFAEKGDTPSAAGTANFGGDSSILQSRVDQMIHVRSRNIGREFLAFWMGVPQDLAGVIPTAFQHRQAEFNGCIPNSFEDVEDLFVAVYVTLGD